MIMKFQLFPRRNTSLCGGATPLKNSFSIIISTEKMNNIISIDKNQCL